MNQNDCNDANQSIKESPMGGYAYLNTYPKHRPGEVLATLDGEFDKEDLLRLIRLIEQIEEDALK